MTWPKAVQGMTGMALNGIMGRVDRLAAEEGIDAGERTRLLRTRDRYRRWRDNRLAANQRGNRGEVPHRHRRPRGRR